MDENTPVQFSDEVAGGAPGSAKAELETKYLTREELRAELAEFNRQQQGLRKKQENRIKETVADLLDAAREGGQEITPQLTQAFQRRAEKMVAGDESEQVLTEVAQPKKEPAKPVPAPAAHWVDLAIADITKKFGVEVTATDEGATDLAELKKEGDAVGFLARYREIAAAKAEVKQSTEKAQAQARAPMMGGGMPAKNNPIENITDPSELIKMGLTKFKK
ncbi:conserved hypothetical protein [Gammaproteobacteria bacterium]